MREEKIMWASFIARAATAALVNVTAGTIDPARVLSSNGVSVVVIPNECIRNTERPATRATR
eukprot:XP_001707534.1 Hypothetical protein GL50803_37645 [Giardia lamblia ATCC 50803]